MEMCVMCGDTIPEGQMVCLNCEYGINERRMNNVENETQPCVYSFEFSSEMV